MEKSILGDVLRIKHGYAFKGKYFSQEESEFILVTPGNFSIGGGFKLDKPKYYNGPMLEEFLLDGGELIVTMTDLSKKGDTLGFSAFVPSSEKYSFLHNQRIGLVEVHHDYSVNFVYWLLRTEKYQKYIAGSATGSTVKHTSPKKIYSARVEIPYPKQAQEKIASILSAYDDLIENNLKRIKLLEEKAQLTYEEWFVRMKYPGHENDIVDSETGLPEGWKQVHLNEICNFKFGYPFKANMFNSEGKGTPIIRIRNIPKSSTSDFTTEVVDEKYLVRKGDVLVGMDGEFYINNWFGDDGYLVQRVCLINPINKFLKGFITESIRTPIKILQNSIDGATVAHLGKKHLDNLKIILPHGVDLRIFDLILQEKIYLYSLLKKLKESRDILLPRLMSGMIDIDKIKYNYPKEILE